MSTRAYRVNTKELKEAPSLNMWNDETILDLIDEHCEVVDQRGEDGAGTFEIDKKGLEKVLLALCEKEEDYSYQIKELADDIAFANAKGEEFITYECY